MAPAEVIKNVFRIRCFDDEGTGFTIIDNDRHLFITANHVVKNYNERDGFGIYLFSGKESEIVKFHPKRIHFNLNQDIAVFEAPEITVDDLTSLKCDSNGLILGQDVCWMGFPKGYDGRFVKHGYKGPVGIVGSATVSAFNVKSNIINGNEKYLLQSRIPGGSSGSPVFFRPDINGKRETRVFGVLSSENLQPYEIGFEKDGEDSGYKSSISIPEGFGLAGDLKIVMNEISNK